MDDINVIEVFLDGKRVGRLAQTGQRLCAFEYDAEFLQTGFSISPLYLPLRSGLFFAGKTPFDGNFGVFDDSLPDGWGGLILDRYLSSRGIDPATLSVLQRLALVGTTGRGALEYFPDNSRPVRSDLPDFDELAAETEKILTTGYKGDSLGTLYDYVGSSGGARPKIFVSMDGREWLVKFRATSDPRNVGKIEFEYARLARECGIDMPETRLFEGKYFGTERFDRTNNGKIHTISAAGLLHADYRIPSLDYSVLLNLCLQLTKDMEEVCALFRRMVFNIAVSNKDDHAKNFSFQYKGNTWKLSPAYDLLPSPGFNGFHTTTVNGQGKPALKDILQVAGDAGIGSRRAGEITEQVTETCRKHNKLNYLF
ncbi:MAG: type II toxin-antitoxin system HipA family toxin [Bacteroidales bacterium]|jgi:serine/threonine-protein kinase HipA|nr:type II toxin-antitoxin system HipA family toxin [Bacteroidales bacterium]MCI1784910.1 type II toxin-antitoxin system HipA family toxin [Bacteroidales bacterium]